METNESTNIEIETLEASLKAQPNNYGLHVRLIKTLPKGSTRLESARQTFSKMFPLTPELWTEWIEDENYSPRKMNLYERALEDYLNVPVYAAYLQHAMATLDNVERIREIYNKALQRCALHFTKNALIWAIVIDYEQRILDRMSEYEDEENEGEETDQENRIRKLYMRWIGVPGAKLDLAMNLYEEFENENAESDEDAAQKINQARSILKQTQKHIEPLLKFEERLTTTTTDNKEFAWNAYLNHEQKNNSNVPRMTCLFERSVADCPLSEMMWVRYVQYVYTTLRDYSRAQELARRALRNVSTSSTIWTLLIRAVDACNENVTAVCNEACSKWFQSGADYLEICMLKIACARRKLMKRYEEGEEEGEEEDEDQDSEENQKDWKTLTCAKLRKELKSRNLETKGKKAELVKRLENNSPAPAAKSKSLVNEIAALREAYKSSLQLLLQYYPTWHQGMLAILKHIEDAERLITSLDSSNIVSTSEYWNMCLQNSKLTESGTVAMYLACVDVVDNAINSSEITSKCREFFRKAAILMKEDLNAAEMLFYEWRSFELRRGTRETYEDTCSFIEKRRSAVTKRVKKIEARKITEEEKRKKAKLETKKKKTQKKRAREESKDNEVEQQQATKRSKTTAASATSEDTFDNEKKKKRNRKKSFEYHETTVYIRGIPNHMDKFDAEKFLRTCLEKTCGEIAIVQIVMNKYNTTEIKGSALVEFKNKSSVNKAVELSGKTMQDDLTLTINRSKFPPKSNKKEVRKMNERKAVLMIPRAVKKKKSVGGVASSLSSSQTTTSSSTSSSSSGGNMSNSDFRKFLLK